VAWWLGGWWLGSGAASNVLPERLGEHLAGGLRGRGDLVDGHQEGAGAEVGVLCVVRAERRCVSRRIRGGRERVG